MTPEEKAREQIDAMLVAAGWIVDFKAVDFSVGRGIALREVPLKTGPCDCLLIVDRKSVGVIEAKREGATLSAVAEQSGRYATNGMRDRQIEAISGLEKPFAENRPRALIHMATGAGKTFTACAVAYRLIKYAKARRILFLVDRANLGEQARDEFHRFRTPDTGRLFTELYNVQHLTSSHIDDVCRVTVCTIQRLYSILHGEELAEGADDLSGAEIAAAIGGTRARDVACNAALAIEKYDPIFTRECHRSIHNLRRQALEYFGSFFVGLTATDLQSVSGEDARAKPRFVIVDAVRVCKSDKTESRPLDRQPTMPLKTPLQRVILPGGRDKDKLTTLAARLERLDRELEPAQRKQIATASGGHTPATPAGALLRAFDPDAIAERAAGKPGASPEEIAPEKYEAARQELIVAARAPFDKPALRQTLETLKKETEQARAIVHRAR
jgi:type I site-specific restriction endonuclease